MSKYLKYFREIGMEKLAEVGGKNASLGEMYCSLSKKGLSVPDGFALTASAYWKFITYNSFEEKLRKILRSLDQKNFSNLRETGNACRTLLLGGSLPKELMESIKEGYDYLIEKYGENTSFAARSSATAEDLPTASFAGQLESYLNVKGYENLLKAIVHCYASLFTDRAIKYRIHRGFNHMEVALSVGIQQMVRSDMGCSGVMFTMDPDSGFENVVLIAGAWGLGENVVQGNVNPDEFLLFKPFLDKVEQPIISRKLGSKNQMMQYSKKSEKGILKPEDATVNKKTPIKLQNNYVLEDEELKRLAKWAVLIEKHYKRQMDIEWAKDGISNELYIVQARPETVYSQKKAVNHFVEYKLLKKGKVLTTGIGLGNKIVSGKARLLSSPAEMDKLAKGEILVTGRTDPDWNPILKKAAAIVTDQGGRTSHAAIVAREMGAIAIVGATDASQKIKDGQIITVSTVEGNNGYVYEGKVEWQEKHIALSDIQMPHTQVMLILAQPEKAFKYALLPNNGVGLLRMEFIISNSIQVHPMALLYLNQVKGAAVRKKIKKLTQQFENRQDYFIQKLAEATAMIAAAFYPKTVIVRMSDLKSNEYAHLLGGDAFEPKEQNPMIGLRGASRYYHEIYRDAFKMECMAMKKVREEMGFENVKLMIPFCRTVEEARKVVDIMEENGLKRGNKNLQLYMMVEIPSNALRADDFAPYFDGFSIGSNDLTQLTLGADRDSEFLTELFSPFDPAVMDLISMSIEKARKNGLQIGLCGQAPSDYPDYAEFLVKAGINSISFNPDAIIQGIKNIEKAERKMYKTSKIRTS